ncbi:cyanophycin synthetase (plasmid) [Deinococcus taeanensis]|uniref:Mur ligase family protein n=1 Tax=Deinococcus taeanensis TaxID=2737050 RepID=UPI001CDCFC1D|nr:Mur ligase family protein [Deinococcus taeanensis]UBV44188.1 cyanophycin synthetase [Deinococcus taeanensis]
MRVLERAVYRGPHIYALTPMIRLALQLGEAGGWPAAQVRALGGRVQAALDALALGSLPDPGVPAPEAVTLGDLIQDTALALQRRAGAVVTGGLSRPVTGTPDVVQVLFEYHSEPAGLLAGGLALALIDRLLTGGGHGPVGLDLVTGEPGAGLTADLPGAFGQLRRHVRDATPDPVTAALLDEAHRRDIPVSWSGGLGAVVLGQGRHTRRLLGSLTGDTPHLAVVTAQDLPAARERLEQLGVPVPDGRVVRSAEDAARAARRLGGRVLVRALGPAAGRGAPHPLAGEEVVRRAFEQVAQRPGAQGPAALVEECLPGVLHHLLVVGGEVAGVREAREGQRDAAPSPALSGRPDPGAVHPENAALARTAALALGLDTAEVDLVAPDLRRSVRDTGGGIVALRAGPDLGPYLAGPPASARRITGAVMDRLYPPGAPSRVPLVALTGTNGKSTTARMAAHVLGAAGERVGLTTTSGVYVGARRIYTGDATGPRSARMALRHPEVTAAVLETARGGLLREGLGFGRCDVAAVLNVDADHLGLGGIETLEDLSWVKSLLVRVVSPHGLTVLNADDPLTLRMNAQSAAPVALFSLAGDDLPAAVNAHLDAGGLTVLRRSGPDGDEIVVVEGGQESVLMAAAAIPATLGGQALFNVANALAVTAICRGLGVPLTVIREALQSFGTGFEQNPGRMNVFDGHPFRVILDYAHNPAGLQAQGAALRHLRPAGARLIGMVSIPGDRRDEDIQTLGATAAGIFDDLIFREGSDGRGRPRGEVMALLRAGALQAGFPAARIQLVLEERDAVETTLRAARAGDLAVIMPTDVDGVWQQILNYQPSPEQGAAGPG